MLKWLPAFQIIKTCCRFADVLGVDGMTHGLDSGKSTIDGPLDLLAVINFVCCVLGAFSEKKPVW